MNDLQRQGRTRAAGTGLALSIVLSLPLAFTACRSQDEAPPEETARETRSGEHTEKTETPRRAGETALARDVAEETGEEERDDGEEPLDPRSREYLMFLDSMDDGPEASAARSFLEELESGEGEEDAKADRPDDDPRGFLERIDGEREGEGSPGLETEDVRRLPEESEPARGLEAPVAEQGDEGSEAGEPVLLAEAGAPPPPPSSEGAAPPVESATVPAGAPAGEASPAGGKTAPESTAAGETGATDAPLPAERPEEPPSAEGTDEPPAPRFHRAGEHSFVKELFHKTTPELLDFLRQTYPEWIDKGHIFQVRGNAKGVVVFTEKDIAEDPVGQQILSVIESFDNMGLEIRREVLRPRYIDLDLLMNSLVMAGLANIYQLTEEQDVLQWKEGNKNRSVTRKKESYIQTGMVAGQTAPLLVPEKIPYVYEIGHRDPFVIPKEYSGQNQGDRILVSFDEMASTEERGGMMVVGTEEDLERIRAFTDSIDVPARQVMIEIQVIELDANKLSDFGIDSLQFGQGHHIGNVALPLPGESVVQPGLGPDVRRDPEQFVPPVKFEGFDFIFDDTSFDLSGRFLTRLHWLVREGDAKIKARPKILTLDDRTSVLHIGREVPVFQSTGVTRDVTNGNLVSEINTVTTQYIGFTLNIRPRITGGAEDEVSLQLEVVVNELESRQRVFEEDLAGIPTVIKRHYIGQNRVKNHRPIVLGGLIQEQDVESVNKIPLLSDIPLLGYLFRRTQKSQSRNEIILVVTPHILSEKGVDRAATPKESIHFDTFDSVLFNDRHIMRGSDVIGIDPINKVPARGPDGRLFTEAEVVDLTLLNIVKKRELVSKLDIINNYLPNEADELSWFQRRWPERNVKGWPERDQEIFFRAAAIVIENLKELNQGLTFDDIVVPRREIIIPTSPYRISLSYDRVKALQTLGKETVFREGRVEVNQELVDLLQEHSGNSLRNFADFLEDKERKAEDHKDLLGELERLYGGLHPSGVPLRSLTYPEVYRELDRANIDFMTIASFFQTNLEEKYALTGAPDIGRFAIDFRDFARASLSLTQRARRLKELEEKWRLLNTPEGGS